MSQRSEARRAVQHPQAATLGNVVGQVIAHLADPSAAMTPLDRRDRRRLLIFTKVLASARRGGEPLVELITAREMARNALGQSDDLDEAIGFAGELPSMDEDLTNYDLMAKVVDEDGERLVVFLGEAEQAIRTLTRVGRVSALGDAERTIVTKRLPEVLERMSHVNDHFDDPESAPQPPVGGASLTTPVC
jgi:hypothetical protein